MNEKEDEDMLGVLNKVEITEHNLQNYEIDSDCIKELVTSKEAVIVKNGVMQIDSSHPDYDFWMED